MQRIFIGDVQGCADELEELLARARGAFGDRFEVWCVGDLVNRGPASLRALRRARELEDAGRGRVVLGNHEVGLLATAFGLRRLTRRDTFGEVLASPDADDWIDWVRRRPLVVTDVQGEQPFAMVHAAAHPDWSLEELARQARSVEERLGAPDRAECRALLDANRSSVPERDVLSRLTQCRSVGAGGSWSAEPPEGDLRPWHAVWAQRAPGYGVVYGHWSLQGLHVAPWLRGLDTGCVHHGRGHDGALTAWLPDPGARAPFSIPDEHFWHVPARRAYYAELIGNS